MCSGKYFPRVQPQMKFVTKFVTNGECTRFTFSQKHATIMKQMKLLKEDAKFRTGKTPLNLLVCLLIVILNARLILTLLLFRLRRRLLTMLGHPNSLRSHLIKIVSFSHGNSAPENGFSINKYLIQMHGTFLNSDTIEAFRFVKGTILSYGASSTYKSPSLCCNLLNLLTLDMKPNLQQSKDYWSKQAK